LAAAFQPSEFPTLKVLNARLCRVRLRGRAASKNSEKAAEGAQREQTDRGTIGLPNEGLFAYEPAVRREPFCLSGDPAVIVGDR